MVEQQELQRHWSGGHYLSVVVGGPALTCKSLHDGQEWAEAHLEEAEGPKGKIEWIRNSQVHRPT